MATDPQPEESESEDSAAATDEPPKGAGNVGDAEAVDERLAKVQAAFERGDYAQVRALAEPLIAGGGPLSESARDLVQRTRVDPAQVGVLIGCLLFFCFIVWKYVF